MSNCSFWIHCLCVNFCIVQSRSVVTTTILVLVDVVRSVELMMFVIVELMILDTVDITILVDTRVTVEWIMLIEVTVDVVINIEAGHIPMKLLECEQKWLNCRCIT